MADLRDEEGNPIQLTDEFGNPVKLTDEFGNPMHLTGIATTHPPDAVVQETHVSNGTAAGLMYSGGMEAAKPNMEELARTEEGIGSGPDVDVGERHEHQQTLGTMLAEEEIREPKEGETCQPSEEIHRSSSSSSSSEDEGQGGRRKKKGLTQRIKEKLTGAGKHKEEHHSQTATAPTTTTPEHEKKSVMEKIKEKLPGGHHNH